MATHLFGPYPEISSCNESNSGHGRTGWKGNDTVLVGWASSEQGEKMERDVICFVSIALILAWYYLIYCLITDNTQLGIRVNTPLLACCEPSYS